MSPLSWPTLGGLMQQRMPCGRPTKRWRSSTSNCSEALPGSVFETQGSGLAGEFVCDVTSERFALEAIREHVSQK